MKQKKLSLALKTFIGFGLGIVIGLIFQEKATILKPLGTIFLNMIKMIVVPLVFCSITAGVASLGDLRKLRSIGVKVVGLYALTSAISVALGLLMANITNPGQGFDMSALAESSQYEAQAMPSVLDTIVDLCRRRLPERMGIPSDQIQVLSPTRRRGTGTRALNQVLQTALNPPLEGKGERRFGDWVFRAGDRVMQVRNNYDILWREDGGTDSGMGMFNGDIGVIRSIEKEVITVDFDGRVVEYSPDMLGELEPAFAVTVHKAQGSEYRAVILAALEGAPMLMTRGVLYTAVTRARELFILVGDGELMARMVANDRQMRRYSALRTRLLRETGQEA